MKNKKEVINKFKPLQTLAEGIEGDALTLNLRHMELFQPMKLEVEKLVKAGALGVDIVNSLEKFPACKSTVRGWINNAKEDEDKNPAQKGQPSKVNKAKGAGKKTAAEGETEGFTRSRILKNVILATVSDAIGDEITDETTVAEAVKIAKATCSALGRKAHKLFADELASVDAKPDTDTEDVEEPKDVADIIDKAEADNAPEPVDARDAVAA